MKLYHTSGNVLMLCAAFLLILISGCKKQLKLLPYNQVAVEQAFNTKSDFDNAMRGVYRMMLAPRANEVYTSFYGGADAFGFAAGPDILSDNLTQFSLGRLSGSSFHSFQLSGTNTTYFFQDGYAIIRAANAILDNIGNLGKDPSVSDFRGQALAVRGLVYFDLMRLFAKTPGNAGPADLGVPIVLKVTASDDRPKRDPVPAVYAQIESDLKSAATLVNTSNQPELMNRAAVFALLSRLYLYELKYPQSVIAADSSLALNSDPASIASFPSVWNDVSNAGVLFKLKVTPTTLDNNLGTITIGVGYGQTSGQGDKAEFVPAFTFASLFQSSDIRRPTYFRHGFFSGDSILYVIKYAGKATGNQSLVDVKLIRVAEVLLNKAESSYRAGDQGTALMALNALRLNRYANFIAGNETGMDLLNAILLERRLELAFEGDRFFDLKRLNLPIIRSTVYGDVLNGKGIPDVVTSIPAGDPRFQLPIDNNSLNANTNIKQNPGY